MLIKNPQSISTLGALKRAGYQPQSIKTELRNNLIVAFQNKTNPFSGILDYDQTVIPELQTAILARHNILLLGLRGQAKTRIARLLVNLLDEWTPYVADHELHDDPILPITKTARDLIEVRGDDTPIAWLHRSERYVEKLATPDVTVADLIGDLDPIKAAALKLSYSDERVIHFGLIPRANRSIFVINELPDLQPRIQVALFNILQERDIQIRGFKLRLPVDVQFIFTANPEDYTNRGSIVTPLKDRIESQILTHYPRSLEAARDITLQEARVLPEQRSRINFPRLIEDLIAQIAFEARQSEYVDAKSGVSARLTISAYENVMAAAERRILLTGEKTTTVRVFDLYAAMPAITGKIELVYEGEQEGAAKIAHTLISKAIRSRFAELFPNPDKFKRSKQPSIYQPLLDWFNSGNAIDILRDMPDNDYKKVLLAVEGLKPLVSQVKPAPIESEKPLYMEFILHGLAEFSQLSKQKLEYGFAFKDILGVMFGSSGLKFEDEE